MTGDDAVEQINKYCKSERRGKAQPLGRVERDEKEGVGVGSR